MSGAIDAHTLLTHVAVLWAYAIVGSVTALVTAPVWSPGRGGGRGAALAGLLWPVAIPVTLTWLAVCALRRARDARRRHRDRLPRAHVVTLTARRRR